MSEERIYKALSDPELVSACLQGDAQAWEALITRYRRLIYSVPVRFNFPEADASDVFQTICLKLLEHLHELKDENKVAGWLVTTTTRHCIRLRAMRYRESPGEEFDEPLDPSETVEEIRIQSQREQAVRDAAETLTGRCQKLIAMLYFDVSGPSYEQISKAIGMPVSSIGPTRARCLEKLRLILRHKGIK